MIVWNCTRLVPRYHTCMCTHVQTTNGSQHCTCRKSWPASLIVLVISNVADTFPMPTQANLNPVKGRALTKTFWTRIGPEDILQWRENKSLFSMIIIIAPVDGTCFYLAHTLSLSTKTFLTWSSTAAWFFAWMEALTLTERLMCTHWAGERKITALLQRVAAIFAKHLEGQRSTGKHLTPFLLYLRRRVEAVCMYVSCTEGTCM